MTRLQRLPARAAPVLPPSRARPLPRRPCLPLLRRHRLPGPARRGGRPSRVARVVSPRVAGGAVGRVRSDHPPVWSGQGVGACAEHARVCRRLVGGAPVGHGALSRGPSPAGRPEGRPCCWSERGTRCKSAGVVRRGREHAARAAGWARPRGSAGRPWRGARPAPRACTGAD